MSQRKLQQADILDDELYALAGVTSAANKLPYFTGSGTADVTDLTAAGRALIDDTDAAAQRTTLSLNNVDNLQQIPKSLVDAKGDLIAGTADNTPARLPVGDDGDVLTVDSAESTGVKWAPPSGGGGGGNVFVAVFTSSGTFTGPTGVTEALVEAWAAGGGGGGGDSDAETNGGGGGGGGYSAAIISLTPTTEYDITVGVGGTPGAPGIGTATSGGNGGNSLFEDGSLLLANGGIGGGPGTTSGAHGAGGTSGVGNLAATGGTFGTDGTSSANGGPSGGIITAVIGTVFGKVGGITTASTANGANGADGNIIGGGGAGGGWSGGSGHAGGTGARGEVRITYLVP